MRPRNVRFLTPERSALLSGLGFTQKVLKASTTGSQTHEKLSRLTADAVVTHLVQKLNRDESRRAHARIPDGGDVPVLLLAPIFVDLSDRLVYNPKFVVVRRKGVPP
jgi:hypothetical protein